MNVIFLDFEYIGEIGTGSGQLDHKTTPTVILPSVKHAGLRGIANIWIIDIENYNPEFIFSVVLQVWRQSTSNADEFILVYETERYREFINRGKKVYVTPLCLSFSRL